MVGTIGSLVQVAKRQWLVSTGVFLLASMLGGGILGLVLGELGRFPRSVLAETPRFWVVIIFACIAASVDVGILRISVFTRYHSVPQRWWIIYGPVRASIAYGIVLGIGVTTFIPFAGFYVLLTAISLFGLQPALAIGTSYGVGRGIAVILASLSIGGMGRSVLVGRYIMSTEYRFFARRQCALGELVVAACLVLAL